ISAGAKENLQRGERCACRADWQTADELSEISENTMRKYFLAAALSLACAFFVSRLGYGVLAGVHVLALFALYAGTGDLALAGFYGLGLLAVPLTLESMT